MYSAIVISTATKTYEIINDLAQLLLQYTEALYLPDTLTLVYT